MKITLCFRDPYAVQEKAEELVATDPGGRSVKDIAVEIHRKLEPWIEHKEYIVVEFDFDAGTATVLKDE